jgi:hypothetical protein
MAVPNPIPTGPYLNGERQLKRPTSRPKLRASWTATVLLSPVHGEFVNPRRNGSVLLEVSREIIRTALDLELRVFLPGLRCGGNSAYSRPGGAQPYCFGRATFCNREPSSTLVSQHELSNSKKQRLFLSLEKRLLGCCRSGLRRRERSTGNRALKGYLSSTLEPACGRQT